MDILHLCLSLGGGILGGLLAGLLLRRRGLGLSANAFVGLLGGGALGALNQKLDFFNVAASFTNQAKIGEHDLAAVIDSVACGLAGGLVLVVILGLLKGKAPAKKM